MTKREFVSEVIQAVESLQIEYLDGCYDIDTYAYDLVDKMTDDNNIEWETEDG